MSRLYTNLVSGSVENSGGLASSDTTLESADLADIPVVSSPDTVALVLDPLGDGNGPEIVHVTDHTSGATSATISRAAETKGAAVDTAQSHANGTAWVHSATEKDIHDDSGNVLGGDASGSGDDGLAIHPGAVASGTTSISVGDGTLSSGDRDGSNNPRGGVAIGNGAQADGQGRIAVGPDAAANSDQAIAIGRQASSSSVAIGRSASATAATSTAVGRNAAASDARTTAIGEGATANQNDALAIGHNSEASAFKAIAIGGGFDSTTATADDAIALGYNASGANQGSVAIGRDVATSDVDQVHFGPRHIALDEMTAPTTPPADELRLFAQDDGSGNTELVVIFPSGNSTVLASGV